MNIAIALADHDHLSIDKQQDTCPIVRFQPRETFSVFRDGFLCETLHGTKATAVNRIIALSNRYPAHDWQIG